MNFHKLVRDSEDELAVLDQMEIDVTKYSALWNQNHPAAGGCGKESEIESGMVGSFRKLNIDQIAVPMQGFFRWLDVNEHAWVEVPELFARVCESDRYVRGAKSFGWTKSNLSVEPLGN